VYISWMKVGLPLAMELCVGNATSNTSAMACSLTISTVPRMTSQISKSLGGMLEPVLLEAVFFALYGR